MTRTNEVDKAAEPAAQRTPSDPAAFVASAESLTNTRDLDGILATYADDAVLESITDGAREVHRGRDAIRAAWSTYLELMRRGGFALSKRLLAADGEWITNSWYGTMAGSDAYGLEAWRFGPDGRVAQHLLYSFLNVRPSDDPVARLRLLAAYPVTASRFLAATRSAREPAGAPSNEDAEGFMESFARGWSLGSRSAFFDHFQPIVDPDIVLVQPPFPPRHGWDGFVGLFEPLFELMPDLHGTVRSWTRTTTGVRIQLDLAGTLRGREVRLRTRDDLVLRDGRIARRHAHLDPRDLIRIAARPSTLPTVVRLCVHAVRAARR